jgi:alkyl hydroperoxide reductase subunit AhpC
VGFNPRNLVENYLQHPVMFRLLMPQVVVIDRKGIIRAQLAGDDKFFDKAEQEKNFRDVLEPLLKEGTVTPVARRKKSK